MAQTSRSLASGGFIGHVPVVKARRPFYVRFSGMARNFSRKNMNTLNSVGKISQLVGLAIEDVANVKENPAYVFNVGFWHVPLHTGRCSVCIAGAVMAGTLESDPALAVYPTDFDSDTRDKLSLINGMRKREAWAHDLQYLFGMTPEQKEKTVGICNEFHNEELDAGDLKAWRKLHEALQAAGL